MAISSPYGDFSKTTLEIKALLASQKQGGFYFLTYEEQLAEMEKRRQDNKAHRKRHIENKINVKLNKSPHQRTEHTYTPLTECDDDFISNSTTSGLFDANDVFINTTLSDCDYIEVPIVNHSTAMIMIGGISGIDTGGNIFGDSDSLDNSINDPFSSFDNTTSSAFDDSFDTVITDEGEW